MKKILMIVLFCCFAIAENINVLAAANLAKVLTEIKKNYLNMHPNDQINITYIASGKAYAQIKNQAPVHLFVSADTSYPQKLFENKLAQKPQVYAQGSLVLWSKTFPIKKLQDILDIKIKNIALPNPELAPYGRAAKEAMEKIKIYNQVKNKISQATSISQAHQWVENKNCEIGFGALSLIDMQDKSVSFIQIDSNLYEPIKQALTITNYGKDSTLTKDFTNFILKSQETFRKYGYLVF